MVAEVFGGLSAFNSMFSIAKSIKDMNDAAVRNAAVADLWEQIFTAQTRYSSAVERVNELEAKLASFETWEAEKQRYQMKDFGGGTIAFELKPEEARGEPAHRICPNCYEKRHRSILQPHGRNSHKQELFRCGSCSAEYAFGHRQERDLQQTANRYNPLSRR